MVLSYDKIKMKDVNGDVSVLDGLFQYNENAHDLSDGKADGKIDAFENQKIDKGTLDNLLCLDKANLGQYRYHANKEGLVKAYYAFTEDAAGNVSEHIYDYEILNDTAIEPEDIGATFQNKEDNQEFTQFISAIWQAYQPLIQELITTLKGHENPAQAINMAKISEEITKPDASLKKTIMFIYDISYITEDNVQKLVETADLYHRYLQAALSLNQGDQTKYEIPEGVTTQDLTILIPESQSDAIEPKKAETATPVADPIEPLQAETDGNASNTQPTLAIITREVERRIEVPSLNTTNDILKLIPKENLPNHNGQALTSVQTNEKKILGPDGNPIEINGTKYKFKVKDIEQLNAYLLTLINANPKITYFNDASISFTTEEKKVQSEFSNFPSAVDRIEGDTKKQLLKQVEILKTFPNPEQITEIIITGRADFVGEIVVLPSGQNVTITKTNLSRYIDNDHQLKSGYSWYNNETPPTNNGAKNFSRWSYGRAETVKTFLKEQGISEDIINKVKLERGASRLKPTVNVEIKFTVDKNFALRIEDFAATGIQKDSGHGQILSEFIAGPLNTYFQTVANESLSQEKKLTAALTVLKEINAKFEQTTAEKIAKTLHAILAQNQNNAPGAEALMKGINHYFFNGELETPTASVTTQPKQKKTTTQTQRSDVTTQAPQTNQNNPQFGSPKPFAVTGSTAPSITINGDASQINLNEIHWVYNGKKVKISGINNGNSQIAASLAGNQLILPGVHTIAQDMRAQGLKKDPDELDGTHGIGIYEIQITYKDGTTSDPIRFYANRVNE